MPERSAGILMFRFAGGEPQFLLVHPGGPFWAGKDEGAWSIPKGLVDEGEDLESAARREFAEETGHRPAGELIPLGSFRQPSGKIVVAFALEGAFDTPNLKSNLFSMEWPPKSGHSQEFPEIDRAGWFSAEEALRKILKGQAPILTEGLARIVRK